MKDPTRLPYNMYGGRPREVNMRMLFLHGDDPCSPYAWLFQDRRRKTNYGINSTRRVVGGSAETQSAIKTQLGVGEMR